MPAILSGKKFQLLLNLLVSLLLFAGLMYLVGIGRLASVLAGAKLEFLVAAVLCYAFLTFVMAYRIAVVLRGLGSPTNVLSVVPSNLAGLLASDFTPARVGYFFTAFSISSKSGIPIEKTVMSIFAPQLFDFFIKASSAAILTLILLSLFGPGWGIGSNSLLLNVLVILAAFAVILFLGLLVFYPPLLVLLTPFELFCRRVPLIPAAFAFLRNMHSHAQSALSIKWQIIGITLVTWTIKGTEWFLISRALGITITTNPLYDLGFMLLFQAAVTILQFIPSPTIAGAGASEAAFALLLLPFGVAMETAIAFGLLTRFVMIAVDLLSLPVIVGYTQKQGVESTLERMEKIGH